MASARSMAPVLGDLLTVHISRAAYELMRLSPDRRIAGLSLTIDLKGKFAQLSLTDQRADILIERANELWESTERGQRTILTSLIKSIRLEQRAHRKRNSIDDPDYNSIREAQSECSVRLKFGSVVTNDDGQLLQVISGPDFYRVKSVDGLHVDEVGERYNWLDGYMGARCSDGGILAKKHFFYRPTELWSEQGEQTFMKLVSVLA